MRAHGETNPNAPALMPEPTLDGEREEEAHAGDGAAGDEERFEDVCAHVRNVGDAALLGDVLGSAAREPCNQHGPERR